MVELLAQAATQRSAWLRCPLPCASRGWRMAAWRGHKLETELGLLVLVLILQMLFEGLGEGM